MTKRLASLYHSCRQPAQQTAWRCAGSWLEDRFKKTMLAAGMAVLIIYAQTEGVAFIRSHLSLQPAKHFGENKLALQLQKFFQMCHSSVTLGHRVLLHYLRDPTSKNMFLLAPQWEMCPVTKRNLPIHLIKLAAHSVKLEQRGIFWSSLAWRLSIFTFYVQQWICTTLLGLTVGYHSPHVLHYNSLEVYISYVHHTTDKYFKQKFDPIRGTHKR